MLTSIRSANSNLPNHLDQQVIFLLEKEEISLLPLIEEEITFLQTYFSKREKESYLWSKGLTHTLFIKPKTHTDENYRLEYARKAGARAWSSMQEWPSPKVYYSGKDLKCFQAFVEGLMLASYRFDKYKSQKKQAIKTVEILNPHIGPATIKEIEATVQAVYESRDLVNEPPVFLDVSRFVKEIERLGVKYGFETETLEKEQIASLKMNGLLTVNLGSENPPAFVILKHSPKIKANPSPIMLVGKGVVFDTGGLSLKPTANSMDFMKSDMAGAAAVVGTFCAIAQLDLPWEVIGLIPLTDNRPGYNAMAPGDIITFSNGKTVEILNTDAEGRLILADALLFAQQYKPQLVVDLATLTGSAASAIGKEAAVMMGNATQTHKETLVDSGLKVFERLVEFPLWEEYEEQIHSDFADITNFGGPTAGAIAAGKFLEHFIDFDWVHLDIAGPSYLKKGEHYKPAGGSGFGVRLMIQFLKTLANKK